MEDKSERELRGTRLESDARGCGRWWERVKVAAIKQTAVYPARLCYSLVDMWNLTEPESTIQI